MKVLVTGASGFVGAKLCRALVEQGINVTGIIRKPAANLSKVKFLLKELSSETSWHEALEGVDVVIHLAGRAHVMVESEGNPYQAYANINIHATKHLAEQAALAGVKRFVFLSSVKVNGESTGVLAFNEKALPNPEDDYGMTKHEAEKALMGIANSTNMEVVIIRPPLIYGVGVKANFQKLIKLSCSNLPLPFAHTNNKRSLIFIENLIDFIKLCMHHPKAANQTFLVSDDDDVSTKDMVLAISAVKKIKVTLLPLPEKWVRFIFRLVGKKMLAERLLGNLQVDINKAKTLLNWRPIYSFKEGISQTVRTETPQ